MPKWRSAPHTRCKKYHPLILHAVRREAALLAWFDRHRRDLPWRRTQDPYAVWLSEVMLQQTRVESALPYYERFLARFPTVRDLAEAELEDVLAQWSGLGYYRRARQLHAAAQQVVATGGRFPTTVEGLLELPGIGAYTAAAVASIAFGVAVPVLDGNVERVLCRLLALEGDPRTVPARRRLLAAAAALLDPGRPGDSNQAMMELGATLCSPKAPKCLLCPLRPDCRAAAASEPERYPAPRRRRETERVEVAMVVVEDERGALLFRRPEGSALLAGTWELPWVEAKLDAPAGLAGPNRSHSAHLAETAEALGRRYGGSWRLGPEVARVRHGITFRDLHVAVHRGDRSLVDEIREGPPEAEELEAGWFDAAGRSRLPLSSLVGKVFARLPAATPRRESPAAAAERPRRRRLPPG